MYAQKKNPHKEINFLKSKKKSEPILKINIDLRREQKKKGPCRVQKINLGFPSPCRGYPYLTSSVLFSMGISYLTPLKTQPHPHLVMNLCVRLSKSLKKQNCKKKN